VNIFGHLSKIYLEKIENGEMIAYNTTTPAAPAYKPADVPAQPSLVKQSSGSSVSTIAPNENLTSSSIFQIGNEVMSLFKKLQKKDAITKVKALKAMAKYVEDLDPEVDASHID
jgi:hypothetical protein